ncbi:hypothetical protein AB4Z10_26375 [Bosea sp. RAF48]|uniref:hypothetical protein n=1 Tax=Bosea sp. RAF48 TaxID=3237480 RepID=UPI003F915B17
MNADFVAIPPQQESGKQPSKRTADDADAKGSHVGGVLAAYDGGTSQQPNNIAPQRAIIRRCAVPIPKRYSLPEVKALAFKKGSRPDSSLARSR